jgi:hypothetical protein
MLQDFSTLWGLTPNPFYLLSRACGRVLLFNSILVLVLGEFTFSILYLLYCSVTTPLYRTFSEHFIVQKYLDGFYRP